MRLKTPKFWEKPSALSTLLSPLSCLYLAGHKIHQARQKTPYTSKLPILCVGNAVAGGSGKTPAVLALTDLLLEGGLTQSPLILTRGYGGRLKGPTMVSPDHHTYEDVGDEALLLVSKAMTCVCANRGYGAQMAELGGADLILMDDGLQNRQLEKTLSLMVVDEAQGLGNGKLLPAGPLREPLKDILARTDAILLVGETLPFKTNLPVFRAAITPRKTDLPEGPCIAFAGLGRPEKFEKTLRKNGIEIQSFHSFTDHHPYRPEDLALLLREAEKSGARLLTTEKDHVRLPGPFKDKIVPFPVRMVFETPEKLLGFLKTGLSR